MRTLDDLLAEGVRGRRVLVRVDVNVPLDGDRITDDGRIRAIVPTVGALMSAGARVVLVSHLGRPQGAPDPKYSLHPVSRRLSELLGEMLTFAEDTVGEAASAAVAGLEDGQVALLENVRFNPGETSKDVAERQAFAAQLARFADVYVDDAFGAMHRRHASVCEIAGLLPAYAGSLVLRELEILRKLIDSPERPYVVVLGGAKVSDKLAVISRLLPTVDKLLVGGGMCFTFFKALGYEIGESLLEEEQLDACRELLATGKVILPADVVIADRFTADADFKTVPAAEIEAGWRGLDIGPAAGATFAAEIESARTVFWNGPMGVFELVPFSGGTRTVAEALTKVSGLGVVGGGDSAAAVRALGLDESAFGHISTGGGASLEFLEGKPMPGLVALEETHD
ncbi:MAG: phosphoglycerate kinase [Longispora sp.]|nr:phosphoglycerate kinase [Longispora sp. (in: high G+C Gram-positive bacteria)]